MDAPVGMNRHKCYGVVGTAGAVLLPGAGAAGGAVFGVLWVVAVFDGGLLE